jgi:Flp pilus assembly protein TadB
MSVTSDAPMVPVSFVILTGCTTVVLASALAFVFWKSQRKDSVKDQNEESSTTRTTHNEIDREVSIRKSRASSSVLAG